MIPITRKEQYINEIVGNGDTAPEKPVTREEIFFSAILGEAVPPKPISKNEMYLSKISGADIEIPEPTSRHEIFLAKAAGMDISTPVPITREEMLWSNYTGAVEFTLEGIPPLSYKADEGTLKNYRIYGNTVDGASVGELVTEGEHAGEYRVPVTIMGKNLFNETVVADKAIEGEYTNAQIYHQDGKLYMNGSTISSQSDFEIALLTTVNAEMLEYINKNFGVYQFSSACPGNIQIRYIIEGSSKQYYTTNTYTSNPSRTANRIVFRLQKDYQYNHEQMDIQIEKGNSSTSYEPYHTPVTTSLYLPKPLKMVGDEAEYIDYAEQKQHVDADEEIEKQATTYMVSITPKTDVSKIEFVTMSSVPDDCTILISGLIFTLDEADANTLNSTNYADGVRGNASTAHNYKYTWTKRYTEGETYYIRSYVKYQTADNEIKEVYGDVYKADINGFERVRKNLHVTLPALPTLTGTNVLSVGTEVQPSKVYVKGKKQRN